MVQVQFLRLVSALQWKFALPRRQLGFTLLELMAVISIISLLIGLLIPAVQMARESARKLQCQNHLKQIGLALENYHGTNGTFPPASIRSSPFLNNGRDNPQCTWTISILPFLDATPVYKSYVSSLTTDDPANATLRGAVMPVYLCPTDIGADVLFEPRLGVTYRRGNYGANFGAGSWGTSDWSVDTYRGVMGQNASVGHAGITDGSSNTVMVAELRIQPNAGDNRGVWGFPAPGSASVGLDCDTQCRGINGDSVSDWIPFCTPMPQGLNCSFQNDGDSNAGPRSRHARGANLLICDGSVRFVNENVFQATLNAIFTSQNHEVPGEW